MGAMHGVAVALTLIAWFGSLVALVVLFVLFRRSRRANQGRAEQYRARPRVRTMIASAPPRGGQGGVRRREPLIACLVPPVNRPRTAVGFRSSKRPIALDPTLLRRNAANASLMNRPGACQTLSMNLPAVYHRQAHVIPDQAKATHDRVGAISDRVRAITDHGGAMLGLVEAIRDRVRAMPDADLRLGAR